jgi:DNA-binding PadR family transcriptional regulator
MLNIIMKDLHQEISESMFFILLSLSSESLHGYGIMKKVKELSSQKVGLGPGTLYRSLAKLSDLGLIKESSKKDQNDPRRLYYDLTQQGKKVLISELEKFQMAIKFAGKLGLL